MPRITSQELVSGIVQECHTQFSKLPKHGKPAKKTNGQTEWTILAGIVMAIPVNDTEQSADKKGEGDELWDIACISLATGSKCLPQSKLSPRGDVVNDCHAEVLARRGFNRWCLAQMQSCIGNPDNPKNIFRYIGEQSTGQGEKWPFFELVSSRTQFHLYVSQSPCGDATTASLALTQTAESKQAFMNGQKLQTNMGTRIFAPALEIGVVGSKRQREKDIESLPVAIKCPRLDEMEDISTVSASLINCDHVLELRRGRVDYDSVGVLRTKPGRVDSEPTLSMSCSDKIARWNVLGITSALVAPFLKPIFLQSIVICELFDTTALERALFGRIKCCRCSDNSLQPTQLHPIDIHKTTSVFEFSKESITAKNEQEGVMTPPVACPSSISWIASESLTTEVLVNGCKAGASARQPLQSKSRSRLCKLNMFKASVALWKSLPSFNLKSSNQDNLVQRLMSEDSSNIIYADWKAQTSEYNTVKQQLFQGVFQNWVKNDKTLEMFNVDGEIK
ncbi:tRNA-specific adenosine deaminase 1 [Lobosporangium transversale]|uniref:tRNA-specific adenosine deaminase 1 n=1 Tax=Lobosporangium transversale TaxID=64571 RepID=A0A1Y2GUV4_9FUNG|nr:adenosine deaminase/editase [Lobosporangium transversale]KAF9908606.1 tRNA-specific adenosine deaminase 1 [Lobosporangium transversale]ORZ21798.1 adenosine deaminase/editase [Lobosporangium transversale]|eukprot:XP_021883049.1 adenosine deaminase/editase [Lobosporangium transversale]